MDSDYYNVTEVVAELEGAFMSCVQHINLNVRTMIGATLEAPGMVKRDGVSLILNAIVRVYLMSVVRYTGSLPPILVDGHPTPTSISTLM